MLATRNMSTIATLSLSVYMYIYTLVHIIYTCMSLCIYTRVWALFTNCIQHHTIYCLSHNTLLYNSMVSNVITISSCNVLGHSAECFTPLDVCLQCVTPIGKYTSSGPGGARRGAWRARTVRATAAAVKTGATRRGARGSRIVRATDSAAVGPGGEGERGEGWGG